MSRRRKEITESSEKQSELRERYFDKITEKAYNIQKYL